MGTPLQTYSISLIISLYFAMFGHEILQHKCFKLGEYLIFRPLKRAQKSAKIRAKLAKKRPKFRIYYAKKGISGGDGD